MSDEDKVSSVSIYGENREWVEKNVDNFTQFVNEAVEAQKVEGTADEALLGHRIDKLRSEKQALEAEKNKHIERIESEQEIIQRKIEILHERREELDGKEDELLGEAAETVPLGVDADNPAVENYAAKLDISPERLLERIDGHPRRTNPFDGLQSVGGK